MPENQARAGHGRTMDQNLTMREWLDWLTRVRLLLIALILAVGVVWPQYVPGPTAGHYFLPLIVFWITLGTIHIILLRWLPNARWHGAVQAISDVAMVSALVYATGLQDSYFISLYLLVIIVASILFSRGVAFTIAAICVVILGTLTALAHAGKIPRTFTSVYTAEGLRFWFLNNTFGFFAIAYLASLLAHRRHRPFHFRDRRASCDDGTIWRPPPSLLPTAIAHRPWSA